MRRKDHLKGIMAETHRRTEGLGQKEGGLPCRIVFEGPMVRLKLLRGFRMTWLEG